MQKKIFKPLRKSEEEEPKAFTDRLAFRTDELVERSINSDLSLTKEESYSISNLKQDWDAIKVLQDDIKKTSDKLKQLGNIGSTIPRPTSECGKVSKHEKKSKIETPQSREIKKLQEKIAELSISLSQQEKEKRKLLDINTELREELENVNEENNELKVKSNQLKLNNNQNFSKKSQETHKYAQFVTKKIRELPKWEEMFMDRVNSVPTFLNSIKSGKYEESFLSTLQFLSDLLVYSLKPENFAALNEPDNSVGLSDDSENLLLTINAQNERIAKLNRQISDAMISSKELLYSPLAPVIKKDSRATKSTCYNSSGKVLYDTPDRWRMKKDVIPEMGPEEEYSGKPLG